MKEIILEEGKDFWIVGSEPIKSKKYFYINCFLLACIIFLGSSLLWI